MEGWMHRRSAKYLGDWYTRDDKRVRVLIYDDRRKQPALFKWDDNLTRWVRQLPDRQAAVPMVLTTRPAKQAPSFVCEAPEGPRHVPNIGIKRNRKGKWEYQSPQMTQRPSSAVKVKEHTSNENRQVSGNVC